MKKILTMIALSFVIVTSAHAGGHRHNDLRGVILGAGGGALLGQALGRNTQSTVIGTAVGGVVGYLIGTEMDKHRGYTRHRYQESYEPTRYYYTEPVVEYKPVRPNRNVVRYSQCRETEFLGTINGKPKKIYGTACKTPHGWELVSEDQALYSDRHHPDAWQDSSFYDDHRYQSDRGSRWVKHRF